MNTEVGSIDDEFNRMIQSFSSLIETQQEDFSRGMNQVSRAMERAVQRFSDTLANTPAATGGSGESVSNSGSSRSEGTARSSNTGVMMVRVVNSDSEAVPVRKVQSNTFGNILGGIGSFIGNFIGGIAGGFMAPITAIITAAQIIVMLGEIIIIVNQVRGLVRFLIGGLAWFMREFFGHLYKAGLLPVSRLIAALLLLIDYGVTIVLRHITPYLDWVSKLIHTLIAWLGDFINALGDWLQTFIGRLSAYLGRLVDYLIDKVVRKLMELALGAAGALFNVLKLAGEHIMHTLATGFNTIIDSLLSGLFGIVHAAGSALVAAGDNIRFAIIEAINIALSNLHLPTISNPRPTASISSAASTGFAYGQTEGRRLAAGLHIATTAPTQTFTDAARTGYTIGQAMARGLATEIMGPLRAPGLRVPEFENPDLNFPEVPEASPQLRRLLGEEEAALRARQQAGEKDGGVTLKGDVNVQIRADTVDMENSDRIARDLAEQMMEEMRRLARQEQFSRGQPT